MFIFSMIKYQLSALKRLYCNGKYAGSYDTATPNHNRIGLNLNIDP